MEEFMTKNQADYYSGITSITVNGKATYEPKGRFFEDLRKNAFSRTNGEDEGDNEGFSDLEEANEGFSDLEEANNDEENEIAKIFRIETNLFD
ncbi:hypothetical protein Tco_0635877 [Tanacetum coccineum]